MSTAAPRPIRFVHQGRMREVSGLAPTTTVLQWLRDAAHCTGTKEGCAEGDCGACTVVVGERDPQTGTWRQQTVNACIQLLPMLDGKALLTVEDVADAPSAPLHPCQQAMVNCHGSQCGFCTPGFVMSLWDVYERHAEAPTRAELAEALSGNLCRCTGYRPILEAGLKMYEAPRVEHDKQPLLALLQQAEQACLDDGEDGLVYEGPDADPARQAMQRFHAPRTLQALARLRAQLPHARLLAGCTDIGLWVTKQFRPLGDILYLGRVAELSACTHHDDGSLEIGAAVSLEAAWSALTRAMPMLREIWKRFAAPPVRHAGTLVGNLANGSPIGDSAPILLALDATLLLRRGEHTRTLPLSAFYLDYMKHALQPGEFIQSVRVPCLRADQGETLRAYKLSKRRDSDISAVCAGLWLKLDGDRIVDVRLGFGGMAATSRRATQTEQALRGQPWNEATLRLAQAALRQDFQPLTDLRASSDYRITVAVNLLERFWLETRPGAALPPEMVQVWPAPAA
ncbi:MAG: xanthine dehydrogenase small subunit [Aquabacterium sp.]